MQINYNLGDPIYAMIGDPVAHSLSPIMHNTFFTRNHVPGHMIPIHVHRGEVPKLFSYIKDINIRGLSITMPHKQAVMEFCDEMEPVAKLCEAVNCIAIHEDGKVCGYNTDALGLKRGVYAAGMTYDNQDIMIIGAGAVTHPITYLMAETAKSITFINRTYEKAVNAARFIEENTKCKSDARPLSIETLKEIAGKSTMMINTTCIGMHETPDQFEDLSFIDALAEGCSVVDLIYNPYKTEFLKYAEKKGHPILNGLPMLIQQGFLCFEHMTGVMPKDEDYDAVVKAMGL